MRNHVTRRYRSEYQGVCTMSHSICFPPRKVTAKVYVTKMASQKKVPQITTTNKNNKNTTDLRFQTLSSASLWCARILFVNERERGESSSVLCRDFWEIFELNLWASIPLFFLFLYPKGRQKVEKSFSTKKNISTRVCMVLNLSLIHI